MDTSSLHRSISDMSVAIIATSLPLKGDAERSSPHASMLMMSVG